MKTNQLGINLITQFEGFRSDSYKLEGEDYYTIGYGHSFDSTIKEDTVWTKEKAISVLKNDLTKFENIVSKYSYQYGFTFNENQFSALVSYTYNRGSGGLKQLLSNSKSVSEIAKNIVVYWGSAELYKNGLIRRRKAEAELFLKPIPKSPVKKEKIITYTIKKGDSLTHIASAYKTSIDKIMKLNTSIKNPNIIIVGKKIKVPDNR